MGNPKVQNSRCDRCFQKHLRCNRGVPECDQCILALSTQCTYKRVVLRKKKEHKGYSSQLVVLDLKRQTADVSSIAKGIRLGLHPLMIVHRAPFQTLFSRTMTFLQYPCPQSSPKVASLLIWLASKQGPSDLPISVKLPEMPSDKLTRLLMKAEQAYFDNANTFIPLFLEGSFSTQPRSELLKATVLATGLLWYDKDPLAKKLGRYFQNYLEIATSPIRLDLSLDTLQAILIIVLGLFGAPWVINRMEYFGMLSLRIAYALGLHVSRLGQEYALASNCLMYLINYLSFTDMPFTCKLLPTPRFEPTLVHANFLAALNPLIPQIHRLKFALVETACDLTLAELDLRISTLNSQLKELSLKFLIEHHRIAARKNVRPSHLLGIFSFYHTYYAFLIASIRMYRSNSSLSPSSLSPPSPQNIIEISNLCSQAIRWSLQVPQSSAHWFFISKLIQLLIFLTRNKSSVYHIETLALGLEHLKTFQETPYSQCVKNKLNHLHQLVALDSNI